MSSSAQTYQTCQENKGSAMLSPNAHPAGKWCFSRDCFNKGCCPQKFDVGESRKFHEGDLEQSTLTFPSRRSSSCETFEPYSFTSTCFIAALGEGGFFQLRYHNSHRRCICFPRELATHCWQTLQSLCPPQESEPKQKKTGDRERASACECCRRLPKDTCEKPNIETKSAFNLP